MCSSIPVPQMNPMRNILLQFTFILLTAVPAAGAAPALHGYGGRGCADYLDTYRRWDAGEERGVLDYFGYQQWLAGMVTAFSLATAQDALRGADIEGMMRRIKRRCEDDREQDVFGAAMGYLEELGQLP